MSERTEELTAEIEATREHLGDTVDALADRLDVKKQAHEKIDHAKEQAHQKVDEAKDQVTSLTRRREIRAGAAAVVAAALTVTALKIYRD